MPDYTPEHIKEAYAAVNKLNPEKQGVTLDEIVIARLMVNMLI